MKSDLPPHLSAPATRGLLNAQISTLTKLSKYTERQILELHGVGPSAIPILREALKVKKLSFKKHVPTSSRKSKKAIKPKLSKVVRGFTIKYHAGGETMWSKGKVKNGKPEGYWQWYRPDGTLKRSGTFKDGVSVGKWTTYDAKGKVYKVTHKE